MWRALVAVIAITGVVVLGVFGPRWLMSDNGKQSDRSMAACNLLNDTCRWTEQGTHWDAQMEKQRSGVGEVEYHLTVTTNRDQPRLLAVLRGESMYLGEYPVPMAHAGMTPDGEGQLWEARFTAPFCSTEPDMTWRIDLQDNVDQKVEMPVKLTFRAEGRV